MAETKLNPAQVTEFTGRFGSYRVIPRVQTNGEPMLNDDGTPMVNEVACKSCGMCMPVCPTGAIQLLNFSDDQLLDEIIAISGGGAVCENE